MYLLIPQCDIIMICRVGQYICFIMYPVFFMDYIPQKTMYSTCVHTVKSYCYKTKELIQTFK